MSGVRLGPFVLSGPRFGAAIAIAAALIAAEVLSRRGRKGLAPVAWNAVVIGILVARFGYVALHLGAYAREPWSALYVWQGGFSLPFGAVAALAYAVAVSRARPAVLRGALLAGAVGAAVWGGWQLAAPQQAPPSPGVLTAQLQGLDGTAGRVGAFVGKPLVVNLWATWCAPCQRELPMLASVASRTPDVTFLFVSQGEPRGRVERYLEEHHFRLGHVYLDAGERLSQAVATKGLPTTLFFDAKGRLVSRWLGELSRPRLQAELARIR